MIDYGRKGRINKRERLENDKYTKHSKAKPYVRESDPMAEMDEEQKEIYVRALLGDWDAK